MSSQNPDIIKEAEEFFAEWKQVKKRYIRLCKLREEKLGILGYISYGVLFIGVMALVAVKLNNIDSFVINLILWLLVAAAAIYIITCQVLIGIYEKKGRKKREAEFKEAEHNYNKLLEKSRYYSHLKSCGYDLEKYKALEQKKKEEELDRKNKQTVVIKPQFNDTVFVYCKNVICGFEADESVYLFRCEPETCRWKSNKKL